jgi:catechol 2,3-dioxygenase-like lactoylglutathione lyase family enzyme
MNQQAPSSENIILEQANFCQIGIVVKNIDETIDFYSKTFGFGPFEVRYVEYPDATYYGETAGYRGKRAFFHLGNIQIELIELVDGKTIHEDFLKQHGECLHHIGFKVKNLDKSKENAEKAGLEITQGFQRPDGSGFAYLDTDKTGGVIFELIKYKTEQT